MKRKIILVLVGLAVSILLLPFSSQAGEIDILVQKLVDKGVLSQGEAQQILTETKEEVRAQLAKGDMDTLPAWIRNMKLKGDFRLRYQYDDKDKDSVSGRNRGRIRYRLGIETDINDQVKVAAGLASGSSDPRSTNQTFQDTFSTKGINLDYAYVKYAAQPWLTLFGGKMIGKDILWEPTDLLWDGDITPEGGAAVLSKSVDNMDFFANLGFFPIDESSSASDEPYMGYIQPGVQIKLNDNTSLKGAVTAYTVQSAEYDIDNSAGTNTLVGSNHKYDYDAISPAFELGFSEPLGGVVPYFSLFGEYVKAFDPDDEDEGFAAGIKFGDKKVSSPGQWQIKYIYRYLERDAWLDALPDSDAYDGDTNVKGHEIQWTYGLSKNITFGLDYYYMQPIKTLSGISDHSLGSGNEQHVIQADLVFKF